MWKNILHDYTHTHTHRVIRKSLWNFRPMRYSSRDGHAKGEHVNSGKDTPNFCHTLQVLDRSTLSDAADVNPVIKFLLHTLHVCSRNLITGLTSPASPRVDISSTCKVEQKLWVSLPLLTCSPLAWPSRLLYRIGRKSRRHLWITLYIYLQLWIDLHRLRSIGHYVGIHSLYHSCIFTHLSLRTRITVGTTSTTFDDVYEIFRCPHYEAANMFVKADRRGQDQRFRRGYVA